MPGGPGRCRLQDQAEEDRRVERVHGGPALGAVAGVTGHPGAAGRIGQETLSRLLADGIADAPEGASPLQAVAVGPERASGAMGSANRELGPRLKAAVEASTELQERDALKSVGLAAAMTAALVDRGAPDPTAHLAGELGVLAFKRGYAQWSESDRADRGGLAPHALPALEELRAATASLG